MAVKDLINLGISPDSGTGDSARRGGEKINALLADIYSNFGDNPIGNDPNAAFYGYRRPFYEYEYKVGELHPAGKFTTVRFTPTTGTPYDTTYGYGVDNAGAFVDADGDAIPDIYRDSEWYFLTRGEAAILDLNDLSDGEAAHIVLPLAKAGDVIKVRDSLNTWNNKYISVWTTPYEFQTATQVTEWKTANPYTTKTYPDSDSITVIKPDGVQLAVPYKRHLSALQGTYPNLTQSFSTQTLGGNIVSPVTFYDKANVELEFTYRGADYGWLVKEKLLFSTFDQIDMLTDSFSFGDWIEWTDAPLVATNGGVGENEIETGQFIMCVAPAFGASRQDITSSTTPAIKCFRKIKEDDTDTEVKDQLNTFLRARVTDPATPTDLQNRIEAVLGENALGVSNTSGFVQTDSSALHKQITIPSIVDTSGNIILVSSEPFEGFVQLMVPVA